jgi:hypothetical protein
MGLAPGFSGSATVSVAGGGRVVAAVQETDDAGRGAKAFEGMPANAGADTIYMASMMCNAFGGQNSYYAIQNVGNASADVEIDFYDRGGNLLDTATGIQIAADDKASEKPCDYIPDGSVGSAVIRSTNGQPLVAIGKISGGGLTPTAFLGETAGSTSVAAPYIRWANDPASGERANIAIMNVGTGPATQVDVKYYDNQGNLAATHTLQEMTGETTLDRFIKANSNPSTSAALDANGNFGISPYGGAIEVESDQPVVVVVRVARSVTFGSVTKFAEDYNGSVVP